MNINSLMDAFIHPAFTVCFLCFWISALVTHLEVQHTFDLFVANKFVISDL